MHYGLAGFLLKLVKTLQEDFGRWKEFKKSPRHATHFDHGVIELMPCADRQLYAVKYVTGHPDNTLKGRLSVVAVGQLSEVATGYPLMISEMTLLTALRTAATSVLAAQYLAQQESACLAIIGTGAQSEFQTIGFCHHFRIREVRFYDVDKHAMQRFAAHMAREKIPAMACDNIMDAVDQADIIITATASKQHQVLFNRADVKPGAHINALGGDCPGKTELGRDLLTHSRVVVEYLPQSLTEGEIQLCGPEYVYAELWELVGGFKSGRENDRQITIFDSVGFALEDFSALRLIYALANDLQLGRECDLLPELADPKDLYGLLRP